MFASGRVCDSVCGLSSPPALFDHPPRTLIDHQGMSRIADGLADTQDAVSDEMLLDECTDKLRSLAQREAKFFT